MLSLLRYINLKMEAVCSSVMTESSTLCIIRTWNTTTVWTIHLMSLPCAESCTILWSHMGRWQYGPHAHLGTRQTDWSSSCHSHCTPCATWTWNWEGPQTQHGCSGDLKNLFPCQNLDHNSLVMQPTAQMLQWLTLQFCVLFNTAAHWVKDFLTVFGIIH